MGGLTLCAIAMDELSIKGSFRYNARKDEVEGFDDFGSLGKSKYVSNHAVAFMVKGLVDKWKQPISYFLSSVRMSAGKMKPLLFELIKKPADVGLDIEAVIVIKDPTRGTYLKQYPKLTRQIHSFRLLTWKSMWCMIRPILLEMRETTFQNMI